MESNEVNSSFFPPPPTRYKLFTNHNITLATKLQQAAAGENYAQISKHPFNQNKQSAIVAQEVDFDLRTLVEPPHLQWIRENEGWSSFGDQEPWPHAAPRPSLEGMPKLYHQLEPKHALQALLNTLIHAYIQLLDVLANQGPVSLSTTPSHPITSKTDQIVSHIELAAFNMHGLCNDLRPRQARESLKLILRHQANEKRRDANRIRQTCDHLRTQLVALKADSLSLGSSHPPAVEPSCAEEEPSCSSSILTPSRPVGGYDYALLAEDFQAHLLAPPPHPFPTD